MSEKSLDPRVNRLDIQKAEEFGGVEYHEQWPTFEVFHQDKRGKQHIHVGSVHAPDPELALVFAKEQYGRRKQCTNLWVVNTSDIYAFRYEDADMFESATAPEKKYRDASGFSVRDRINKYKKEHGIEVKARS